MLPPATWCTTLYRPTWFAVWVVPGVALFVVIVNGSPETAETTAERPPAAQHILRKARVEVLVATSGRQLIGQRLLEVTRAVEVRNVVVAANRTAQNSSVAILCARLVVLRLAPV